MASIALQRLFEHYKWANGQILRSCCALDPEQLDTAPLPRTTRSIRHTLTHLVSSQKACLSPLTVKAEEQNEKPLDLSELEEAARVSGQELLAPAQDVSESVSEGS